jgi:PAH dioxygenase large subunit
MALKAPSVGFSGDHQAISDLFDFERHRVSSQLFTDPALHRLELERIFMHTWCFVGMESEIAAPGDYVARSIGADPVIVARDDDGTINVMLNSCTHRGTQLCMTDSGSANSFKCPYHGWDFNRKGHLIGVPAEAFRFGDSSPRSRGDADLRVARSATYRGLIFATWDDNPPSLEEYLGDARWYMDAVFGASDKDLIAVGKPQRWTMPSNWKYGSENFTGDGYHGPSSHASMTELGIFNEATVRFFLEGVQATDERFGHSVSHFNVPRTSGMELEGDKLLQMLYSWLPPTVLGEVRKNLTPEHLSVLEQGDIAAIGTVFPNFSWVMQPTPGGPLSLLRTWIPVEASLTEVWTWTVGHPDSPPELRRAGARMNSTLFGAGGVIEQDDLTIWARMQLARKGFAARTQFVDYSCSRPANRDGYFPDGSAFPGPGTVRLGATGDDTMWQLLVQWHRLMTQSAAA